jgi:hypothetical protein
MLVIAARPLFAAALCICLLMPVAGWAQSGFIASYPELREDPVRKGARIWFAESANLASYERILLAPVEVWYHRDSPYQGIDPGELNVVTDTLVDLLAGALEPRFPLVGNAGPGVLLVRLAIVDVRVTRTPSSQPYPRTRMLTPLGIVSEFQRSAAKHLNLRDARIEAELLDADTGERLGVLVDRLAEGGMVGAGKTWDAVYERMAFYAKRFRARMDAAHGQ